MSVNITYMGTKRHLASHVRSLAEGTKAGIFLDVFAGMCSVGESIGTERAVWSNDAQVFAATVARALFTSKEALRSSLELADTLFPLFDAHRCTLRAQMTLELKLELKYLAKETNEASQKAYTELANSLKQSRLSANVDYSLFTRLYANTYIGVVQAIDVDALVFAINAACERGTLSQEQQRWCVIALGRALLKTSSTTGHFAQFVKPTPGSFNVMRRQRERSVWGVWFSSIDEMSAVGDSRWRKKNRVFNEDSITLLERLSGNKCRPGTIYADPPYTDDQYSRFYHLLETLVLYDEPVITGIGRYREARFVTAFSLKSRVCDAFHRLTSAAAACGSDLLLSYPSNGLLFEAGHDPADVLREYYSSVSSAFEMEYNHSTMGSSKGSAKEPVTERIYLSRKPR